MLLCCPEADTDGLMGDQTCLCVIHTTYSELEIQSCKMFYLHRFTRVCLQHTQFQTSHLFNNKQQQEGDSHAQRLQLPWRQLVWCLVPVSGLRALWMNLVFRKSLVMTSLGWRRSTWASLHESSHRAHSFRYATMTHAPFSIDGVMRTDRILIYSVKSNKNELHDELGISFSSLLCYLKKI